MNLHPPSLRLPAGACWGIFAITLMGSLLLGLVMGTGALMSLLMRWTPGVRVTDPGAFVVTPGMLFLLAAMGLGFALAWVFSVMARKAVSRTCATVWLVMGAIYHGVLTCLILAQSTTSAVHLKQAGMSLSVPLALFTLAAGALSLHLLWKCQQTAQPPPLSH